LVLSVNNRYGFGTRLNLPFETAVEQVKAALKEQGFGVLTEIDVQKTMKEKLGVDFQPYLILGACNPPLAHQALSAELDIGLLLPCNVIVYAADDAIVVEAMDPEVALGVVGNPAVEPVARAAREKLVKALEKLAGA